MIPVASHSWPRPRAAWTSKKWRRTHQRKSFASRSIRPPCRWGSHARTLAYGLGLEGKQVDAVRADARGSLSTLYVECDASLVEVNPLIVNGDGDVVALDGKIGIEDNSLFRQKALVEMRDPSQEDDIERRGRSRPQLRFARWRHRLHGQWRRPCDGNHGCHPGARRLASQLPRRGRRRDAERVTLRSS